MKKFFFLIIVLVTLCFQTVYAGSGNSGKLSQNSSWKTILNTDNVLVRYPTVSAGGIFTSVDNMCTDGAMLKANNTYEDCVKWESSGENTIKCIKKETKRIVTPRLHTKTSCAAHQITGDGNMICKATKTDQVLYPDTVSVDVYVKKEMGENSNIQFLFKKDYDISKCP